VDAKPEVVVNRDDAPAAPRTYLIALVVAALVAGLVGFVAGSHRNGVAVMIGKASVGNHVATIQSGDWFYGVRDSVAWFDASGSFHDDGWPTCLGDAGNQADVKFAAVPVTPPTSGLTYRDVVYIDCRGR
jgi:hypothetical protein